MLQKRLFYCRNCEIQLRSILRQGYLRMSEQRDLPESMAWRVIGRLESGQTQRSVTDTVGVARSVVARMWNRFKETGNLTARRNRTENATQLQRQLLLTTGRSGCRAKQHVIGFMREGLYARRPMVCIPLTPHHRAARRRWAAEHRDWEQHDWSQVLFTDESQFSLESDTRRVLVWRDRALEITPHSFDHNTEELVGWMIMPDHIDLVWWRTCLKLKQYSVCNGQRALPDLNPIEHVWDMLGRRIAARPSRLLLFETWRLHFLRSGTVFPKSDR
ncbi:transposable element Tcb1 transposase [Trichonephila clavipes]|nr:transposable element Tcb1 transposase [Trichonephila clavipes]